MLRRGIAAPCSTVTVCPTKSVHQSQFVLLQRALAANVLAIANSDNFSPQTAEGSSRRIIHIAVLSFNISGHKRVLNAFGDDESLCDADTADPENTSFALQTFDVTHKVVDAKRDLQRGDDATLMQDVPATKCGIREHPDVQVLVTCLPTVSKGPAKNPGTLQTMLHQVLRSNIHKSATTITQAAQKLSDRVPPFTSIVVVEDEDSPKESRNVVDAVANSAFHKSFTSIPFQSDLSKVAMLEALVLPHIEFGMRHHFGGDDMADDVVAANLHRAMHSTEVANRFVVRALFIRKVIAADGTVRDTGSIKGRDAPKRFREFINANSIDLRFLLETDAHELDALLRRPDAVDHIGTVAAVLREIEELRLLVRPEAACLCGVYA